MNEKSLGTYAGDSGSSFFLPAAEEVLHLLPISCLYLVHQLSWSLNT